MVYNATLQALPAWLFKHWHNIRCLADPCGEIPPIRLIARNLGIRPCRTRRIVSELIDYGVLEERPNGYFAESDLRNNERAAVNALFLQVKKFGAKTDSKLQPCKNSHFPSDIEEFDRIIESL